MKTNKTSARLILSQIPLQSDNGQSFIDAYSLIFREDLIPRLRAMIEEYGAHPKSLCWEMQNYGWELPVHLLAQFPKP